jgi:ferredoxin-NADP reductase
MGITAQTIGLAIGWLLVGWVGLQGTMFAVRAALRRADWRRRYERERDDFCRRVVTTARAARASNAITEWTGWRPFRVAAIVDEAAAVKSFYFTPVDGRPLLPFGPGQYLTFRLPQVSDAAPLVRCYSLSDRPRQDYYRATIKRIGALANHPNSPAGRGSSYFHDRVRVGDVLDVRAPAGTFFVDSRASDPVVLVGAGIGITPLVSMIEAYIHSGRRRDVFAIFGFRNSREHPFKQQLQRMVEANPWIHLHTSYSAPLAGDVLYKDYNHRGRITIDRLRAVLPSNNFQFYVCGPGPLMDSLVPALWEWGVPESHVCYEAFGPASVRRIITAQSHSDDVRPCDVQFERSGVRFQWQGLQATILEFGEAGGVAMPSGCRAGSCGECMVTIRRGNVKTIKKPGIPVPDGSCLTCISQPDGELVLDA